MTLSRRSIIIYTILGLALFVTLSVLYLKSKETVSSVSLDPAKIEAIVKGSSMNPGFKDGDKVELFECPSNGCTNQIRRGMVVLLQDGFLKRIIALPQDEVKIQDGALYLNGQILNEEYLANQELTFVGEYTKEGQVLEVPAGFVFAMGDNRAHVFDSRHKGPVPISEIQAYLE